MSVINTNTRSLVAQQALTVNNRALSKAMEQLSTGKRINSAADDAAGLAIGNKMTAQVRSLNQAVRNANDAVSMIQTVEGATSEVSNLLLRMRELAVQSANGTNATADRTALNDEFKELKSEITRISDMTQWNGTNVTNGSTVYKFQVGANSGETIDVTFKELDAMGDMTGVMSTANLVDTVTAAAAALTLVDNALKEVDAYRGNLGAKINRLTYAADNLTSVATNVSASRSRILDTDYAKATTELARTQIVQQAATAMLAQANQQPSVVLSLLR